MNAKPAPARRLAASAALALVAAINLAAPPAAAQYGRSSPYGRPSPYGDPQYGRPSPYGDPQYGRDYQYGRQPKRDAPNPSRSAPGAPLLAVVALAEQRVTIYDANGKILQAPVSTGMTGLETPAGIYSVVQKEEFHQSNVYEDGNMPFMQRITWTGIALHAGVLPGQPASHGCVRMPPPFAQRLFGLTEIGLRVVVVRDDIVPADITHPALFKQNPRRREAALVAPANQAPPMRLSTSSRDSDPMPPPGSARHFEWLKSIAAAKSAEADAAAKKAAAVRQVATRKAAEAAPAARMVREAEANKARAQEMLERAERALEPTNLPQNVQSQSVKQAELAKDKAAAKVAEAQAQPDTDKEKAAARLAEAQAQLEAAKEKATAKFAEAQAQLEAAKDKAAAKVAEAQARLEAAKAQAQTKADSAARANEEAKVAEGARDLAVEAAAEASRKTSPVSVFISRKTQRLYIRQGYQPVFEAPVTIRDADKPIGSYVFTALSQLDNAEVRWSVVSMYKAGAGGAAPAAPGSRHKSGARHDDAAPADVAGAKAALDRIAIPQDAIDRISEVVLPGSSLIVSDEGASIETGKDTDFVVLMSGEPQGGIKTRHREQPRYRDDFFGGGRGGGGSFFPFFN